MLIALILSVSLIGLGVWILTMPLDALWMRQERFLLSCGIVPQQNPLWEESARGRAWIFIALGVLVLFILIGVKSTSRSRPPGIAIKGHQLSQAEWDTCNRNVSWCAALETQKHQQR